MCIRDSVVENAVYELRSLIVGKGVIVLKGVFSLFFYMVWRGGLMKSAVRLFEGRVRAVIRGTSICAAVIRATDVYKRQFKGGASISPALCSMSRRS